MNNRIANDLIRYAELVEDGALISPEEMNCASVMRLAAEYLVQPAVAEQHKQEPVALQMDVIVVNLVREGINKHRARELAEHFIKNTTLPQPKPLTDEAAMFAAQHKFLEWNRQQDGRPVKVAYEYGVFQKAIELYNEAAHGIKEKNT